MAAPRIVSDGEGRGVSRLTVPTISDLVPNHIKNELLSSNMNILNNASLQDPQQIRAEGKICVVPDRVVSETITIFCFSQTSYTAFNHTNLMCGTIYEIFQGESTNDIEAVRLFVQALVLIFGKGVINAIKADQILERASVNLVVQEINPNDQVSMDALTNDPEAVACRARLGVAESTNPQTLLLAYCGAVLLLAGKQINDASAAVWTARRVRGLAASMGTVVEQSSIIPFHVATALRVYQKLSLLIPLRASMVRVLFGSTGLGTQVASMSATLLNLLAWSEMNHVRMVQEYLFGRFPELLMIKQLQGSTMGILKTAWTYLESLDERERPYAKLLYGPQQTKALQRDRFVLLTDAAHAVGSYLHSSFTNYQGDTHGTAGSVVQKIVTEYLMSLERTGGLLVQAAQYTTTDQRVLGNVNRANRLYNQQIEELEAEVRALMRD